MKPQRVFLPAILSGVLLWAAFFPLDLGPVAFFALVPFLTLVRAHGASRGRRYAAAFASGLVFSVLALKWVRVAHPMMALFAWPALSLYLALYWPIALFLLRRLDTAPATVGLPRFTGDPRDGGQKQPPLALTLPIVWVALEYFRAHFPTGFPFLRPLGLYQPVGFGWYDLGYTQHRALPLTQAADIGGVYLISALVAAVNGAIYEWAIRSGTLRRWLRWPTGWVPSIYYREFAVTAGAVGAVSFAVMYGAYRLASHDRFEPGPLVAALQGNLPQDQKILSRLAAEADGRKTTPLAQEYFPLAWKAWGDPGTRRPDLIVWPETCYPENWDSADLTATADREANATIQRIAAANQEDFLWNLRDKLPPAVMLLGLNRHEWSALDRSRKFNSALLVRPDSDAVESYDKMHLVPFGEYVPLKAWLPWLQRFTPYSHDYSCTPGERLTRFELPAANGRTYRFGALICYEDSDPDLARQYHPWAGIGPGVDFLVNISNDGWFDGTEEHEQHLAICRFRAIEARRSVVRAVNMGISAMIDPDGRVVSLPGETWGESKKARAVVRAEVPLDQRGSAYAAAGDWLPALCWIILIAAHFKAKLTRRTDA